MKSGATESSFYYLSQYYKIPNNVEISRSIEELAQSKKQYKILWAHDNCDQPQLLRLPELVSQIDCIVCVSKWEKEEYIKYNRAPAEKIVIIPNGVADIFVPSSQPKSKTAIYFSGPHKGITPLPKIWKQVIKNHPDAKLKVFSSHNLYGEQYEEHFKIPEHLEVIEELKTLPGVEYSPCIDREELLPHIQDAAFFIHPNVWEETFCVAMGEAMACGCYPITSDIGALSEISFGRGKYIPMTGNVTAMGWEPSSRFINEFAQELSRCFEFFDKEPESFYQATNDLSRLTREVYDWKKIASYWKELVEVVSERKGFDESYTQNQYEVDTFSPDDVVLDIGAHQGFFTKLCLDKGCKQIHSFEPEPKNFECLMNNLKEYKHVQPYNLAVLNKIGEKEFHIVPGINTGMHSFYQKGIATKVKTVGLDDILINFPKVELIKIDAEGSEYEVLMKSKLLFKVNRIVGEYHDDLTDKTHKDLFAYLEGKNFTITKMTKRDANSGIFFAQRNPDK